MNTLLTHLTQLDNTPGRGMNIGFWVLINIAAPQRGDQVITIGDGGCVHDHLPLDYTLSHGITILYSQLVIPYKGSIMPSRLMMYFWNSTSCVHSLTLVGLICIYKKGWYDA
ncbi:5344_t:CDS:2 [Funneliformis caledonium]|uniref:5344_t:CDS:1 n=1 Tax=Funneliformis caledonium TaxID=1117310 RepID=A0A9N9GU62_9GLOM|nr:5344_t:CDS:2 [Funneliformis caledonium]